MKIISFGFRTKNKIIYFVLIIIIADVTLKKIIERKEIQKNKKYNYFESYLITLFGNISYVFGIIIYLIKNYISYKNHKEKISKNSISNQSKIKNSIKRINFNKNYLTKKTIFLLFFLLIVMYSINIFLNIFKTHVSYPLYDTSITLSFFSYIILNKCFLPNKFENHHILSIIIIFILNILLIIYFFFKYTYKNIFNSIFYLFTGIYLGYIEYLIAIKFYTPYFLFFFESCLYLLLNIINIILYFIYKKKINNEIFNLTLLFINLLNFIYNFLLYLIIFYYSSIYIILIELFSRSLIYTLIYIPKKYKSFHIVEIIRLIVSIITFIFILIYIEIIEINLCNLNKNLKKYIIEREKDEIIIIDE